MSYLDNILDIVNESFVDGEIEGDIMMDLTPEQETDAFISFIQDSFTATEAIDIFSNGEELAMYGLIHDAQAAYDAMESIMGEYGVDPVAAVTKARKVVVVDDWKKTNFNRQVYRNAMKLAVQNQDPNALKAQKHKKLYYHYRDLVYKKWLSKAQKYTKDQMRKNKNKAANMKSAAGKQITDKIDQTIKQTDAKGRTKTAIKK